MKKLSFLIFNLIFYQTIFCQNSDTIKLLKSASTFHNTSDYKANKDKCYFISRNIFINSIGKNFNDKIELDATLGSILFLNYMNSSFRIKKSFKKTTFGFGCNLGYYQKLYDLSNYLILFKLTDNFFKSELFLGINYKTKHSNNSLNINFGYIKYHKFKYSEIDGYYSSYIVYNVYFYGLGTTFSSELMLNDRLALILSNKLYFAKTDFKWWYSESPNFYFLYFEPYYALTYKKNKNIFEVGFWGLNGLKLQKTFQYKFYLLPIFSLKKYF